MTVRKISWTLLGAIIAFLVLFDVQLEFSLPRETRQADPGQEARYAACYAARDREIHDLAFGTIDNPDVQKLYITNNRALAAEDCRQRFPEKSVTVKEPLRFKLTEVRFRF